MAINSKMMLTFLFIFTCSLLVSPGLSAKAEAQTIDAEAAPGASPAGATAAGAAAGVATTAGISAGTITALAAASAVAVAVLLSSLANSEKRTAATTTHH